MAKLRYLWVIHTTSTAADANTDDRFELQVRGTVNPQAIIAQLRFPDLPHNERERGRTDQYRFSMDTYDVDMFGFDESSFSIITFGHNAWLPSSIWVIGQDVEGTRRLLASVPKWPKNLWFSTDSKEGEQSRALDVPAPL
jgi:PLAT/LH2 domain